MADVEALLRDLVGDAPIAADTPLLTGGLLDSYAVLELVERLEARFGFVAERGDVTPANLDTPAKIVAWVRRKQAERA